MWVLARGVSEFGRHAAHRGHDHVDAVAEQAGARLKRQRHALDDHGRAVVVPVVARGPLHAARDALPDPVVLVRPEQVAVARAHLLADLDHLGRRQARIDAQILERAVEALDVLLDFEHAAVEGAGHVERAVAVQPAAVAKRHAHLALGHVVAVEVGDPLVRQRAHGIRLPAPLHPCAGITAQRHAPRQLADCRRTQMPFLVCSAGEGTIVEGA